MTSTRRGQIALVAALVALIALAFVALRLDQEPPTSPLAAYDDSELTFATAPDESPVDVPVARVCGVDGADVTIRSIEPVGGSGTVVVASFSPTSIDVDCAGDEPVTLTASLRRTSGESASAEGFVVSYSSGGVDQEDLVQRAVTLCRQLSEC